MNRHATSCKVSQISPPLRGGDEGEGDVCGFTIDRISKSLKPTLPTAEYRMEKFS